MVTSSIWCSLKKYPSANHAGRTIFHRPGNCEVNTGGWRRAGAHLLKLMAELWTLIPPLPSIAGHVAVLRRIWMLKRPFFLTSLRLPGGNLNAHAVDGRGKGRGAWEGWEYGAGRLRQ